MIDHRAHIEDLAVKLYTARRLVKSHTDVLDYLARRHSLFYLADRSVFKCKFNHFFTSVSFLFNVNVKYIQLVYY